MNPTVYASPEIATNNGDRVRKAHMRLRHLLLMSLIAIIAIVSAVTVHAQTTPPPFVITSIETTPSPTVTGVSRVSLTVEYTGGYYLYNVEFQLQACNYEVIPSEIFFGWITPGQSITLTYLVNGTLPISCQASLDVSWGGESKYSQLTQSYVQAAGSGSTTVTFPLTIYGMPNVEVGVNQQYLIYGMVNLLELTIMNNGSGPIYGLNVQIQPQGALMTARYGSAIINYLNPGKAYNLTIGIIPLSTSPITLTVSYSGFSESGSQVSGAYTLSLGVVSFSTSQIMVVPINSTLNVGPGMLALSIANLNPVNIYNVTVQVVSAQGMVLVNGGLIKIPVIASGQSLVAYIPVVVPLSSTTATASYVMSLQLPNGYVETSEGSISMVVNTPPQISISPVNSTLTPGLSILILRIYNPSPATLYNATLLFNNVEGASLVSAQYALPKIGPRSTYYLIIPIYVQPTSSSISLGYTMNYYLLPNVYSGSISGTLAIGVLSSQTPMSVYLRNLTLGAGGGDLGICVRSNMPISVSNVTLTILSASNLYIPTSTLNIGFMPPYSEECLTVPVGVSLGAGQASLSYLLSYSIEGYVNGLSGSLTLSLQPTPATPILVYPLNSTVNVGVGKLALVIRNVEPISLSNVTLTFSSIEGASVSRVEYYVGTLGPYSSKVVEIPMEVPSTSSSISISYVVSYAYAYGEGVLDGSMVLGVSGLPLIQLIGYTIAPTLPTVGETTSITINLVNTGPVAAYNLNVTMMPNFAVRAISGNSIYLGSLSSQSTTSVAFTIIPVRPINTTLVFAITYTDQYGKMHVEYVRVPLLMSRNFTGFFGFGGSFTFTRRFTSTTTHAALPAFSLYVVAAIVVVIVAAVVLVVVRRRKGAGG